MWGKELHPRVSDLGFPQAKDSQLGWSQEWHVSEVLRGCGQQKGRKGSWKRRYSLSQGGVLQTVVLICRKEGRRDSASRALFPNGGGGRAEGVVQEEDPGR